MGRVRERKSSMELKSKNEQVFLNLINSPLLFIKLRQQWPEGDPLEVQAESASLHLSSHIWPTQILFPKAEWFFPYCRILGAEINSTRDNGLIFVLQ